MTAENDWALQGTYYECCRIEGQCPIWFGRDLWEKPCTNLATYQIHKGQVQNVDMRGIVIIHHRNGIGPKFTDYITKGVKEGAIYISDNAIDEQREVLEPFVRNHMGAEGWGEMSWCQVCQSQHN